jgi:holo-[acyl-carrier protein] synthase
MIQGIGVDIVNIDNLKEIIARSGKIFLNRVFTENEKNLGKEHNYCIAYYAMTFAAKEAIFKLFGIGWENGGDFREIEICRGQSGEPFVKFNGYFAGLEKQRKVKTFISLSYDADNAVAVAVLEKNHHDSD